MKFKSIIFAVLSATVMALSMSVVSVSAENKSMLNETEISGISEVIVYENEQVLNANTQELQYDLEIENHDFEKAYKNYILKTFIITEYKSNPDFKSLITEDERIQVPAEGKLVSFIAEESGYSILGTRFTENIFDLNALTEAVIKKLNEEVTEIIYTYSQLYYMDIVYIATAENEYAVAYFEEPPYAEYGDRLVSGTVYPVAEFMDRMSQTFDEEGMQADGESNGGIHVKEYAPYVPSELNPVDNAAPLAAAVTEVDTSVDEINNFVIVAVIAAGVISIAVLIAFIIFNKNKKPEN